MAADVICIDLDRPAFAGALHDPVAALVLCDVGKVDHSFINGRRVIDHGRLTTAEVPRLVESVNRLAAQMARA
jgi:cytosine/adenosine deaminase-related metal-dependent hydrolase